VAQRVAAVMEYPHHNTAKEMNMNAFELFMTNTELALN